MSARRPSKSSSAALSGDSGGGPDGSGSGGGGGGPSANDDDGDWEYWDDGEELTDFWQEIIAQSGGNGSDENPVDAWIRYGMAG